MSTPGLKTDRLCVPSIASATLANSDRVFSRKVSTDAAVSAGVVENLIN